MTKKKLILMASILVVALVAAIICLTQLDWAEMPTILGHSAGDYNTAATNRAQAAGTISENEILIAAQITETAGGTQVRFAIYSVAAGVDTTELLKLTVQDLVGKTGITRVGTASCEFVGDQLASIRNLEIIHDM